LPRFIGTTANFETWYPLVAPFTPLSHWYPLTPDERTVIRAQIFDHLLENDPYFGELHDRPDSHHLPESEIMVALREKIAEWLDGPPYFFRTNLGSPKDVGSCKVHTAEDVLRLLLHSHRIYRLLPLLEDQPLHLVFRAWVSLSQEFRCFIHEGEICGISQYDDSDTVRTRSGASQVFDLAPAAYVRLYDYVRHVIADAHLEDAVLDVAFGDHGFWVIEINPFAPCTDRCLFAGEDLYHESQRPPEIRYWIEPFVIAVMTFDAVDGWAVRSHIDVNTLPIQNSSDISAFIESLIVQEDSIPLTKDPT